MLMVQILGDRFASLHMGHRGDDGRAMCVAYVDLIFGSV
jgi:hypothetical protein